MKGKILVIAIAALCFLCGCASDGQERIFGRTYHLKSNEELEGLLAQAEVDPEDPDILTAIWIYYTQTGRLEELKRNAVPVYNAAKSSGNEPLRAYAGSYLAQSYLNTDRYDSMKYYLDEVDEVVRERNIRFLTAMNSNTKAVYAIKVDVDFVEALRQFRIALDITREIGNLSSEGILLCNIAYTYFQRGDITGLQYAREAYALSKSSNDSYVLGYSVMLMAKLLFLNGGYDEALKYSDELLSLSEQPGGERHRLMARLLHGDIYWKKGRAELAEEYYHKALDELAGDGGNALIETSLSYGRFLLDAGRFGEAKDMFAAGLAASDRIRSIENRHELLMGLYEAYRGLGDKSGAEGYYLMYRSHSDSVFTVQNERAFNNQMMHYERLEHNRQMQEKERGLIRVTRNNHIYVFILVCIAIILGSTYLLYRRQNKMYRQLVEQHQEHLRREKHIKQIGRIEKGEIPETEKDYSLLFGRLEELMDGEHIYRNKDISLDSIAERLDSNRAYISKAINQFSGMSFYDYIHSYRIAEAVSVLSEPDGDVPLKLLADRVGYNSISAFYRCFQKETGVPPSKYREEACKMHKR